MSTYISHCQSDVDDLLEEYGLSDVLACIAFRADQDGEVAEAESLRTIVERLDREAQP